MFLFLRLLAAHFVGDFFFQSDEVYSARKRGFRGATIHYTIVFFTFLLFALPYLKFIECWIVILFAVLTHIVQDEIKIRLFTSSKLNFFSFVIDQILHITFLSPILLFKFAYLPLLPADSVIVRIYNNNSLIIFVIGYILSVFTGAYLWEAFRKSYFKKPDLFNPYFIKYGMFERFIVTTSFLSRYSLVFLIIPLLFRFFSKRLSFSSDLVFNLIYASLIGIFLNQRLPLF